MSFELAATVGQPTRFDEGRGTVVSAPITIGGKLHRVWYRLHEGPVGASADTYLAVALLPAMALDVPLKVTGPISPGLLRALPKIQDIFSTWDRRFHKVSLQGGVTEIPTRSPAPGVGCFFSAGVDSWYSLLKHEEEISKLIFVHGFDILLDNTPLRAKVSRVIREIAIEFHKPLLEVETNVREFSDKYVSWDWYHGAALASVALLLSSQFRRVYIPGSTSYSHLYPLGSHPILDPLWSTDSTELVHDGCEATKAEKVSYISKCDTALRSLRVCWENPGGAYNCGRCQKCLLTMASLRLAGALDRCATFDRPVDLRAVSRIVIPPGSSGTRGPWLRYFVGTNLERAEKLGSDPALTKALRACLSGRYHRGIWRLAGGARNRFGRLIDALFPRH